MSAPLKILVVANPGDQAELVSLVRGAGAPLSEAKVITGAGDDATFARFAADRPTIALVGATLERGDAGALIAAMRDHAAPSPIFVVLLGDLKGPVQNALDALDIGADRFLGRPLTVKALRFAVLSGLGQAAGPWGSESSPGISVQALAAAAMSGGPGDRRGVRVAPVAPAAPAPTPEEVARGGAVVPVDDAAATQPMRVAELRARWEALAEELDEIPDDELDDRPTLRNLKAVLPPAEPAETQAVDTLAETALLDARSPFDDDEDDADRRDDSESGEIQIVEMSADDEEPDPRDSMVASGEVDSGGEFELGEEGAVAEVAPGAVAEVDEDEIVEEELAKPEAESVPESGSVPEPEPESGPEPVPEPIADIAVHETASVVLIPDSELWPPPELRADASEPERRDEAPVRDERVFDAGPVREPTMILTDEPPTMAPAGPPPALLAAVAPRPPRSVTIPPPLAVPSRPAPVPVLRADDELRFGDDFDAALELDEADGFAGDDSFAGDGAEPSTDGDASPPPPVARPSEPPPAGGEFARELRRKMSAMAERLFRGEVSPGPVASGPGHDHHTEIDLRGLDEETPLPAAALTDDLGGATYVGELPTPDPHALAQAQAQGQGTDGRGTAEVGELRRGAADVPAVVARMFAQGFTGRVGFRRGAVEKVIYFDGGRPVFAGSNQLHERMGELLHREGKITREQHDRCRDLVGDTGRRMGEILVERGYLKRRELLPAVRRHIEDIIYSLFAWDGGEYRVVAGDGATGERIRLSRHAAAIILEGVRRKLDHELLEQLLGPPSTVVIIADRDKLTAVTAVADLSREERAALAALDGVADLEQVARASGAGLETVYQLAWSLALLGLVAPRRRPDEDGEAGALVGESDLRIDRERVRTRSELCADADYFALLGVRRDATGFEIRRAYEAARKDFAPESFPPELRRELAADLDDIALVLDEAYRVLRDEPLRSTYRAHLLDPDSDAA